MVAEPLSTSSLLVFLAAGSVPLSRSTKRRGVEAGGRTLARRSAAGGCSAAARPRCSGGPARPRPALASPAQDGADPEQQPASHQKPGCPQQLARAAFLLDAQQAKVVEHESYPNTHATGRKRTKPNRQQEPWTGQPRQSGEMYAQSSPSGFELARRASLERRARKAQMALWAQGRAGQAGDLARRGAERRVRVRAGGAASASGQAATRDGARR
jgi:hypothetical protein